VKIPYNMVAAVNNHRRHANIAVALEYGWPRLQQVPIDDSRSLTIACFGPSLRDTWQTMTRPILSMSGATRWLAERGVVPDYHIDMDPRQHKVQFIDPPIPNVHYLMASLCHPDTWRALKGQQVTLWHCYSCDETYPFIEGVDPGELVVRGGSTIGITALHIGGVLGYNHFEVHGMDGSFADAERQVRHAGEHPGTKQNKDGITWKAGGVKYYTSKIMSNAVAETINQVRNFPMFTVFHGNGLTQALVREGNIPNSCCADDTEKAAKVRRSTATIINTEPTRMNATVAWDKLTPPIDCDAEMEAIRAKTEPTRAVANYNTGSITPDQMRQLRALCISQHIRTVIEIGTFIGNSTLAFGCEVYTCDKSNDCLPATDDVHTFPHLTSTQMLHDLVKMNVKADLFFFDGRIQLPDLPLILRLSHPGTIYAFDDFTAKQKGVVNVQLLGQVLPVDRMIIEPDARYPKTSTLALIVPRKVVL
jgi:predicted O-methyltransferase YrrM